MASFKFSQPVNPAQGIINVLKLYKPGANDASIVGNLAVNDITMVAYAIFSLIEETTASTQPFANSVNALQDSIKKELIDKERISGEAVAQR